MTFPRERALYIFVATSVALLSTSAAFLPGNSSAPLDVLASQDLRHLENDLERQESPDKGLVLDKCRDSDECVQSYSGYYCLSVNRGTVGNICSSDFPTCRCMPDLSYDNFQSCDEDLDCADGEVCVVYTPGADGLLSQSVEDDDLTMPFCASEQAEKVLSDVERYPLSGSAPTGTETVVDTTTPFSTSGGLTLDLCRGSDECVDAEGSPYCISVNRGAVGTICNRDIPTCRCIPSDTYGLNKCSNDKDCIVGEVCVTYTPGSSGPFAQLSDLGSDFDLDEAFCASEEAEKSLSDIEPYPTTSPEDTASAPSGDDSVVDKTTPFSTNGGLTFDSCRGDDDCTQTHRKVDCQTFTAGDVGEYCTSGSLGCRCMPVYDYDYDEHTFSICKDDVDCLVGEGCAKYTGERGEVITEVEELDFTRPFCVSLDAVKDLEDVELLSSTSSSPDTPGTTPTGTTPTSDPSSTPDSEPSESPDDDNVETVCIDASAIDHLPREELVFRKHVLARVLCDPNDSCATPGHMVTFRGRAMRMSTYCRVASVKCRKDQMYVNSPRYRRGIRVKSRTEGLVFTALAARYETRAEELVLAGAVRLGM